MTEKEMNLHYNYVYFNASYMIRGEFDRNEYNSICLRDLEGIKGIEIVPTPLYYKPLAVRKLYWLHNHRRINKIIKLPLKNKWYPYLIKGKFDDNKPICFVFSSIMPIEYIKYLKKSYPNSRFVKIHRDLLKITYDNSEYTEEISKKLFDLRMTYDQGEATKYGLLHFEEIESKIDVPIDNDYPLSDVFFAGKAKDRLPKIIKAYDILSEAGLKCEFYVTHLPEKRRIPRSGITYSDKLMPYMEMLYKSVNTRCMLDINQEGAVGYTSRILEAIMYNKRIIVDNPTVKESKYYDTDYMQVVNSIDEIDPSFVLNNNPVDYHYGGDFSPLLLIQQIDDELVKKFGSK